MRVDPLLRVEVGLVVREHHEPVVVDQVVDDMADPPRSPSVNAPLAIRSIARLSVGFDSYSEPGT